MSPRGLGCDPLSAFLLEDCIIALPRDLDRGVLRILRVLDEVPCLLDFGGKGLWELMRPGIDNGLPTRRVMATKEIVNEVSP